MQVKVLTTNSLGFDKVAGQAVIPLSAGTIQEDIFKARLPTLFFGSAIALSRASFSRSS